MEPVYPIDNYGSAMAPFYSVLAIWVGGVMLVAILKPHARREGLVAPKPYQLFFGRYFLFFVLSQIQAAVIVAGDLLVLKIQCVEPALLFATGAITSLVFSLLIYSPEPEMEAEPTPAADPAATPETARTLVMDVSAPAGSWRRMVRAFNGAFPPIKSPHSLSSLETIVSVPSCTSMS